MYGTKVRQPGGLAPLAPVPELLLAGPAPLPAAPVPLELLLLALLLLALLALGP
jgi:hypothetical protein